MNYNETVDYILKVPFFATKIGTDNLRALLHRLGNPQDACKVIHIAGTNGKGSVAKALSDIFQAQGFSVGLFTSPHLVRINERIRLNDVEISDDDFASTFEKVKTAFDQEHHPSFFEIILAMAAEYFAEKKPDFVIYETGMGGRLDATNVVKPSLSIITKIGLDHTEYLGDTIEKIAAEKAGIIKENVPVVYLSSGEASDSVIEDVAVEMKSPAIKVDSTQFTITAIHHKNIDFSLSNGYYNFERLRLAGSAIYQVENMALALTAYGVLAGCQGSGGSDSSCFDAHNSDGDHNITTEPSLPHLSESLANTILSSFHWTGRMDRVLENIYMDGAHNVDAIKVLADTINTFYKEQSKLLVFAVVKDKDYREMIHLLTSAVSFDKVIVTNITSERRADVAELQRIFKENASCEIATAENINQAMTEALEYRDNTPNSTVFCAGSLYMVGEIIKWRNTHDKLR